MATTKRNAHESATAVIALRYGGDVLWSFAQLQQRWCFWQLNKAKQLHRCFRSQPYIVCQRQLHINKGGLKTN